jgi:hypothetical protein
MLPWIDLDSPITDSTWNGELKNGKAVEIMSLCAIVWFVENNHLPIAYPDLLFQNPDSMYLRNELPLTHGSRPGHSGDQGRGDLHLRFAASMTPKLVFEVEERTYSVFREGLPQRDLVNYLNDGSISRKRCDLIVVPGKFEIELDGQMLRASWIDLDFSFSYSLRIVDAPFPSIVDAKLSGDVPPSQVLVECSVAKSLNNLQAQIDQYVPQYGIGENTGVVYSHLYGGSQEFVGFDLNLGKLLVQLDDDQSTEAQSFNAWLGEVLSRN